MSTENRYGVKVRVKGSDETGYVAQSAINCSWYLPTVWTEVFNPKSAKNLFDTLEEAKEAAMKEYDRWISFYERKEAYKKNASKRNTVVWTHP